MKKQKKATIEVKFLDLLTVLFIALKLLGIIDWSWLWVLSPIWLSILVIIIMFFLAAIYSVFKK